MEHVSHDGFWRVEPACRQADSLTDQLIIDAHSSQVIFMGHEALISTRTLEEPNILFSKFFCDMQIDIIYQGLMAI